MTRVQLVQYAGASGDFNPIHWDPERGEEMGLGGVIAHGMLSMGFLGQYARGDRRARERRSASRCASGRWCGRATCSPARAPSARPTAAGLTLDMWAENQSGEKVTSGEAEVEIE